MSYPENRINWTCPNCGCRNNWREVGELGECGECGWKEKAPKGINYGRDYFQKMVNDVIKFNQDHGIEREHQPTYDNLIYYALCLAGEAGEVANVVKKIWRDGDTPELRAHLEEEMVDLAIFMALTVLVGKIDFDKAWADKHEELYERWANKQISRRKTNVVHVRDDQAIVDLDTTESAFHICRECEHTPGECGHKPLNPQNCGGLNGEEESGFIPKVF